MLVGDASKRIQTDPFPPARMDALHGGDSPFQKRSAAAYERSGNSKQMLHVRTLTDKRSINSGIRAVLHSSRRSQQIDLRFALAAALHRFSIISIYSAQGRQSRRFRKNLTVESFQKKRQLWQRAFSTKISICDGVQWLSILIGYSDDSNSQVFPKRRD